MQEKVGKRNCIVEIIHILVTKLCSLTFQMFCKLQTIRKFYFHCYIDECGIMKNKFLILDSDIYATMKLITGESKDGEVGLHNCI